MESFDILTETIDLDNVEGLKDTIIESDCINFDFYDFILEEEVETNFEI